MLLVAITLINFVEINKITSIVDYYLQKMQTDVWYRFNGSYYSVSKVITRKL